MAKSDSVIAGSSSTGSSSIAVVALPTINNVSMERIDIAPLKKQLNTLLADKADQYWDYVKRFLHGKLTKRELDYFVLDYLTESNISVHNQFFKALIFNSFYAKSAPAVLDPPRPVPKKKILSFSTAAVIAASDVASPISVLHSDNNLQATGAAAAAASLANGAAAKERDGKSLASLKSKEREKERERDKKKDKHSDKSKKDSSGTASTKKKSSSTGKKLRSSTSSTAQLQKREKVIHPKYSLLYCPEVQALKDRMETIAYESGLTGVSRQSVIYMMMALEQHIREILYNTMPVFQQQVNYDHLPPSQQPPPFYLAYQYDPNIDLDKPTTHSNRKPSTSQLTLKTSNYNNNNNNNNDDNQQQSQSLSNDNEESTTTTSTSTESHQVDDPMIIVPSTTTSTVNLNTTTNNNNNNTNNTNNTTTKKTTLDQNPNYYLSKNPLLSFSIPIYKIPENLFTLKSGSSSGNYKNGEFRNGGGSGGAFENKEDEDMTLTTLDLYSTIECNPYILGEDTLNMERISSNRFK